MECNLCLHDHFCNRHWSNIFIFMQFSAKILSNKRFSLKTQELALPIWKILDLPLIGMICYIAYLGNLLFFFLSIILTMHLRCTCGWLKAGGSQHYSQSQGIFYNKCHALLLSSAAHEPLVHDLVGLVEWVEKGHVGTCSLGLTASMQKQIITLIVQHTYPLGYK